MHPNTSSDLDHDPSDLSRGPASATASAPLTKGAACAWAALGMSGTYGGTYLALQWTRPIVEADTGDYAEFLYILTVPLGFLIGTFVAIAIAARAERASPLAEDLFNRKEWAFIGILVPPLVALTGFLIIGAVRNWVA